MMNPKIVEIEINCLVNRLACYGAKGQRIAQLFCEFRTRLAIDAWREFQIPKDGILWAMSTLLDVALLDLGLETDPELEDYASFWADMRAYCLDYCDQMQTMPTRHAV